MRILIVVGFALAFVILLIGLFEPQTWIWKTWLKLHKATPTKTIPPIDRSISPEVVAKLKEKENQRSLYLRCLRIGICPRCGEKLKEEVYGLFDQFSDHKCLNCNFESLCEVLY